MSAGRPIGYVAADVEGLAPGELVAVLAEAGYGAVDWTMEQWDPLAEGAEALGELVGLAHGAGLACPQLMVHQDYVTADAELWEERVARTEAAVDGAAAAGIPSIGIVTGPNRWVAGHEAVGGELSEASAWDLALAAIDRALARARGTGVRVCLEPCWGTLASDRYRAEYALARAGEELAVTVDPSHFVMSGDDVPALVRAWGGRLAHVHLKDAVGRPGQDGEDFWFLLPGEGTTDWAGLLGALDEVGYAGAMAVEFESFTLRDNVFGGRVDAGARHAKALVDGLLATREARP
ncbi:MAG: sugar phosphate isomerase/epimerase [Actinobacteria bacterium]|nr:sugar phosphate isomerase/epimerase [Actinomycetota bacterium]